MKINILFAVVLAALIAGCNTQGPLNPEGSLPIVTGLTLREDACKGDTIVFTWDSVAVEVDDFALWYSDNPQFVWMKAGDFEGLQGYHVAERCLTYSVWAQRGEDHSSALSSRVLLTTNSLGGATAPASDREAGFSITPDTIIGGDATNPEFAQDFFLRSDMMGYVLYSGNSDPRRCPGGRPSRLAPAIGDGFKAPKPDSPLWTDTLALLTSPRFFIELEDGHYGRFMAMVYQNPDTLQTGMIAEVMNFDYQPIRRVRLFD